MTPKYENTKTGIIKYNYDEELKDDDKIQIDLQVKRLLDHVAKYNQDRKGAKIQMSREAALEALYSLGAFLNGKVVNHETPSI
jgi:hypothetical protein